MPGQPVPLAGVDGRMEVGGHDEPRAALTGARHAPPTGRATDAVRSRDGRQPGPAPARVMSACIHGRAPVRAEPGASSVHGDVKARWPRAARRPGPGSLTPRPLPMLMTGCGSAGAAAAASTALRRRPARRRSPAPRPAARAAGSVPRPIGLAQLRHGAAGQAVLRRSRADHVEHPQRHGVQPGRPRQFHRAASRRAWWRRRRWRAGARPLGHRHALVDRPVLRRRPDMHQPGRAAASRASP